MSFDMHPMPNEPPFDEAEFEKWQNQQGVQAMTPTEGRAEATPHDYGMTILATEGRKYIQRSNGIAYNIAPGDVCIDGRVIANCWCGTNHREKAEYHAFELARRYNAVPVLEQQIADLKKINAEMLAALKCMVDDEPCRFDHHGMCQEHFLTTDKGECANAVAKALIRRAETGGGG